ncbi:hypothetical protein SY88_13460 [Clostridiales bacterium PH28_bin88]|nr:hypothetical protein SY88_13460 [Clostridiales bacterium PH28_bin88]
MKLKKALFLVIAATIFLGSVPVLPAQASQVTYTYRWYYPSWWRVVTVQPAPQPTTPAVPAQPTQPTTPTAPTQPAQPPTSTTASYQLNAFEQKVVELVNAERVKNGLQPLQQYGELSRVARFKSEDMRDNNYFGHQSPTYGSPFDLIKKFGITYRYAGENLAAGQQTPEAVVQAWMGSSGHRANILNPNYTHIGVGYAAGGSYRHYWTQMFIGK